MKRATISDLPSAINREIKRDMCKDIILLGDFNEPPKVLNNEISEYSIKIPTYGIDSSQGNRHVKGAITNRYIDYVIHLLISNSAVNNVHCYANTS